MRQHVKKLEVRLCACGPACPPVVSPVFPPTPQDMRKNEDPRLSFSTPEFKEAQRTFTDGFKKNFGKPITYGLIKDYAWSTPQLRKLVCCHPCLLCSSCVVSSHAVHLILVYAHAHHQPTGRAR